ncbi:tubulin epsilon and delta complex protein 2 [Orycteropus afer afer]|uniref:Tubulin epsilon and delta complex protein 2 n=1 Tax=Orycteropus afer afer TaxID=1230840 RepID=A0A8B6ZV72_ORYAF|nr:tubulin epsilon and delta complex protein 2 [Orycteropus afer afer]
MLPADCSRRLVAELQGALDACAERQRQLDRSLRVCRRLLRPWEPAGSPAAEPTPGPESKEETPPPACTPSPQELKELELLTQALEKAVRVRKGTPGAGRGDKAPGRKPRPAATAAAPATSAPPRAPGRAGSRASETRPPRGLPQPKGPPECRLLSAGGRTPLQRGARVTRPSLGGQQATPSAAPGTPETFTLRDKGTLLRLPLAFRKVASQNSRLWAQINSTQTSDPASTAARARFLQKMQAASGQPRGRLGTAAGRTELGRLRQACSLLRLRMRNELEAAPADPVQAYRSLLTLEGLQAMVGRCLHRLQELREVAAEQQLQLWPLGLPPRTSAPCRGAPDAGRSPPLLLYPSSRELQTLVALRLRVAMLDEQLHLEKVLMTELLPVVNAQGPTCLPLCRAVYSLLCEGGEHFPIVLQDEPAD